MSIGRGAGAAGRHIAHSIVNILCITLFLAPSKRESSPDRHGRAGGDHALGGDHGRAGGTTLV